MLNKNLFLLVKEMNHFQYRIESVDHIWDIIFPLQKINGITFV